MNKKGHLLITKKCMEKSLADEFKGYRIWVMLGSIMPDFLYHTYLMGHTWNATFERTMKRLESLREWGGMNWYSCLWLGYLLHYIEDYFTYPHNTDYQGSLWEHILYEKELTKYLKEEKQTEAGRNNVCAQNVKELRYLLLEMHEEYVKECQGFQNDGVCAKEAVTSVLEYYAEIFLQDKAFMEHARLEAQNYLLQGWLQGGKQEG